MPSSLRVLSYGSWRHHDTMTTDLESTRRTLDDHVPELRTYHPMPDLCTPRIILLENPELGPLRSTAEIDKLLADAGDRARLKPKRQKGRRQAGDADATGHR